MTNLPPRVRNCTTHHEACECRERHYQQAIAALRKIHEAALFIGSRLYDQEKLQAEILASAREVLHAFDDVKE